MNIKQLLFIVLLLCSIGLLTYVMVRPEVPADNSRVESQETEENTDNQSEKGPDVESE